MKDIVKVDAEIQAVSIHFREKLYVNRNFIV